MPPRAEGKPDAAEIESRLGHSFSDPGLLQSALTHRSWARQSTAGLPDQAPPDQDRDNERLEFLGDAVLGMRVNERLLEALPAASEGELTHLRAWIVSASNLAAAASRLGLGRDLRMSRAEESIGGRCKTRLLANVFE
ncbi:MAG: ribonuclease III domain-containing protein, partial [Terriglobales bacterium]